MARFSIHLFCLIVAVLGFANSAKLPSYLNKCRQNDPKLNECLRSSMQDALRKMKNGVPELKVPSIDPMKIPQYVIGEGTGGSVNVKQTYTNILLSGLSESTVLKNEVTGYDITTEAFTPFVQIYSDYDMNGRVLLLPIAGNGKSNITLTNLKTYHKIIGEELVKKGKKYLKVTGYKLKLEPEKVNLDFTNLFNGDPRLGDQMNRFMNENGDTIFNELRPQFEDIFGLIFKNFCENIFNRVPYDDIFLQ